MQGRRLELWSGSALEAWSRRVGDEAPHVNSTAAFVYEQSRGQRLLCPTLLGYGFGLGIRDLGDGL